MKKLKRLLNIPLCFYLLCLLFFYSCIGYSQIGCTRQEIESHENLFIQCITYDSCIVAKFADDLLCVFNIDSTNTCISTTMIYSSLNNYPVYLELLQVFTCKSDVGWSSSLTYMANREVTIFKQIKNK